MSVKIFVSVLFTSDWFCVEAAVLEEAWGWGQSDKCQVCQRWWTANRSALGRLLSVLEKSLLKVCFTWSFALWHAEWIAKKYPAKEGYSKWYSSFITAPVNGVQLQLSTTKSWVWLPGQADLFPYIYKMQPAGSWLLLSECRWKVFHHGQDFLSCCKQGSQCKTLI